MHYDFELEKNVLDLPTECPECGEELQLDTGYEKQTLLCNSCDYMLDATREFEKHDLAEGKDDEE